MLDSIITFVPEVAVWRIPPLHPSLRSGDPPGATLVDLRGSPCRLERDDEFPFAFHVVAIEAHRFVARVHEDRERDLPGSDLIAGPDHLVAEPLPQSKGKLAALSSSPPQAATSSDTTTNTPSSSWKRVIKCHDLSWQARRR